MHGDDDTEMDLDDDDDDVIDVWDKNFLWWKVERVSMPPWLRIGTAITP